MRTNYSFRLAGFGVLSLLGAVAPAAEFWVAQYFQNSITRFDQSTGVNNGTVSGGINTPLGMAVRNGVVYATSESPNLIRKFDAATGNPQGNFISANINGPTAIAFNTGGQAFIANFNDNSVSRFDTDGTYLGRFVTSGSGGLSGPDLGMAFGPDGNLYIPSYWNHKVARYNGTTGAYMGDFIATGSGGLTQPRQLLWRGDDLFVSSDSGDKVLRYNASTGAFVSTFIAAGSGTLDGATGMVFTGDSLYVTSTNNGKVLRFNATSGAFESVFASGLGSPVAIAAVPEPATLIGGSLCLIALCRRASRK